MLHDGSIQAFTAYVGAPYADTRRAAHPYGYAQRDRSELAEMIGSLHRRGFQVAIHANGDRAIDDALYAFERAQNQWSRDDARHRIEHCQMARDDQLDAMKSLGVSPSFFIGHVYYFGERHRTVFLGEERARRLNPLRSAHERGIPFTLHEDTPVTPVNPLLSVWAAVNRLTKDGNVLGEEQRITPHAALRAVTLDAAWQNHEEDVKGSIEEGKLADFVVLSDDPLTVSPVAIRDIRVERTIVGGETVYVAENEVDSSR